MSIQMTDSQPKQFGLFDKVLEATASKIVWQFGHSGRNNWFEHEFPYQEYSNERYLPEYKVMFLKFHF